MAADKEQRSGGRSAKQWPGFEDVETKETEAVTALQATDDPRTSPIKSGLEIHVLEGDDAGKTFRLETAEVVVGRRMFPEEKKTGWLLFNEHTVSRMHALLVWRPGPKRYRLFHKSTTNPTLINGRVVQEAILYPDDMVRVGDLTFQLRISQRGEEHEKARPLAEDRGALFSGFKIAVTGGPDQGHQFILDHKVVHIGGPEARTNPKGANWIVVDDAKLPREQAFLVWYEADHRYGIFHAGESPIPTQISRVAHTSVEGKGEVRNLLQTDDMILLGDTVLLVLKHERFIETSKALRHGPKEFPDDAAAERARRQPKKVTQGPHPPKSLQEAAMSKDAYDQKNRHVVDVSHPPQHAARHPHHEEPPAVRINVKGAGGLIHATDRPHDATVEWNPHVDYVVEVIEGPERGRRVALMCAAMKNEHHITIGGPGKRINDIELDESVPNQQAKIHYQDGIFTFINEAGGEVYLNDTPSVLDVLKNGDEIRLGPHVLMFIDPGVISRQSQFELDVVNHQGKHKRYLLNRDTLSVGRSKKADVHIDDPSVSHVHCQLSFRRGSFAVEHKSDLNPTFVNGVSLTAGKERLLVEGDEIQISEHTRMVFRQKGHP